MKCIDCPYWWNDNDYCDDQDLPDCEWCHYEGEDEYAPCVYAEGIKTDNF